MVQSSKPTSTILVLQVKHFHQPSLNRGSKQLPQIIKGEQPSSNPYKPKCIPYLQLNKGSYKKECNNNHKLIRLHNLSSLQDSAQNDKEISSRVSKREIVCVCVSINTNLLDDSHDCSSEFLVVYLYLYYQL